MMHSKEYTPMMWRLRIGNYVINKLACGAIAFLLLNLLAVITNTYITNQIQPFSLAQWVYGLFMIASIAYDAVFALIPSLSRTKSTFFVSAWGYIIGYCFVVNGSGSSWMSGVLGIGTILLFYHGRPILRGRLLTTIVLAWLIPLVCLWLFI